MKPAGLKFIEQEDIIVMNNNSSTKMFARHNSEIHSFNPHGCGRKVLCF